MIDLFAIGIPSFFLSFEANNKEVDGNFLGNILKGALPGAITIMIISLLIFGLSGSLDLDAISIQTIISISATHTCLMVLFKVCKPLNSLRRTICACCYGAFLIIAFLLPQFLEFRPLVKFSQYYNPNQKEEVLTYIPEIRVSADYDYVFNGRVLWDIKKNPSEKNINISCIQQDNIYYYRLNEQRISEEVVIPDLSFLSNGNIVLGGYPIFYKGEDGTKVNILYQKDYEKNFHLDENACLFYRVGEKSYPVMRTLTQTDEYYNFYNKYGANRTQDVQICMMPTVELRNDQLIVVARNSNINAEETQNKTYKTTLTNRDELILKIDTATMELIVNGKKLAPTLEDGTPSTNTYKIEMPTLSFDKDGVVLVNGIDSQISVSNFNITDISEQYKDAKLRVFPYDASYYVTSENSLTIPSEGAANTNVRLSNPSICPNVTTTDSGYYVIDGYYTNFKQVTSSPMPKVDSEYNLILGGVVTDFRINPNTISTTTGGVVKELTTQAKVFLMMLCLLSIPLMRFLQAIVPWIKSQIALVQRILSKF